MADGFFKNLLKKSAPNYYVTVVNTRSENFIDVFGSSGALSDAQLIANFESIPDLFLITNYLADKIANIPIKVVKRSGKDAKNSELYKLIENPNEYQSWNELIKLFFAYYEPLGNAYFYGIKPTGFKETTKLYCLPVEKTKIVLLRDKTLPAWMNEVVAYQTTIGGVIYTIPAEMVMHERYVSLRYDDGSWVYGMSKYIPGDKVNRELKAIHDSKTSIIEQRGALGFISNESENPDPDQSKKVKEALTKNYGTLGTQDKIIVTTEKLKWQQMALGVAELQLIENAKYSFAKMCQLSGFDPVIFSTEGSTFANKKEAVKELMQKVIKPKVDAFYKSLSTFLGYEDQIVPDWSQVEEMQDDRKEMTALLATQIENMIITPKKAHEILYGEITDEEEPPDTFFRKSSLVPADQKQPEPVEQVVNPEDIAKLEEESKQKDDGNKAKDLSGNYKRP